MTTTWVWVASTLLASSALAQDLGDLEGLLNDNVVTGASRAAENSSDAPATSSTITAEDLRTWGIRTVDEAISLLSLGMTVETNNIRYAQFGARGVNVPQDWAVHLLLVVDGHVMNDTGLGVAYPEKNLGIPIEAVDHIEVFLGPGSVLYGTNAMMGTINIVTRRAKGSKGLRVTAEGSLSPNQDRAGTLERPDLTRFGNQYRLGLSYANEVEVGGTMLGIIAHLSLLNDQIAGFHVGPQSNFDDPTDPRSPINVGPNQAYGRPDVWGGVDHTQRLFVPGGYLRIDWGDLLVTARFTRWGHYQNETVPGFAQFNQPYSGGYEGYAHVDASYTLHLLKNLDLRPRLYFDQYSYSEDDPYYTDYVCGAGLSPCVQSVPNWNWRLGAELLATFDWFNDGRFNTMVGTDDRLISVHGFTGTRDVTGANSIVGVFDQFQPTVSAFLQQTAKFTDFLRVNAGVRWDWVSYAKHVSPRVAVILTPWHDGTIKALYSEGFRRPSGYELGFASPGFEVTAPGLRPEVVRSAEVSIEQRLGVHRLKLVGFGNWWDEMITLAVDPVSGLLQYQNTTSIDAYGLNAAYQATSGAWQGGINATLAWSWSPSAQANVAPTAWTLFGAQQPLLGAPAISGNARLAYSFGEHKPTLGVAVTVLGPRLAAAALSDPALLAAAAQSGVAATVPWSMQAKATLTGDVPGVAGLSYRVILGLAAPTFTPYTVGPLNVYRAADGSTAPDYQQISRFTGTLGLEYRL